jgi:hypothetical protein
MPLPNGLFWRSRRAPSRLAPLLGRVKAAGGCGHRRARRMTCQLVCGEGRRPFAGVSGVAPLCEKLTGRALPDVLKIAPVVFLSSIGAEKRHGAGFVDGLARIEQRLDAAREQTGTALLHLRCGYFMTDLLTDLDGLRAGRLTTTRLVDDPKPWVDPREIATVATLRLLAGATGPAGRCRRCTDRPT